MDRSPSEQFDDMLYNNKLKKKTKKRKIDEAGMIDTSIMSDQEEVNMDDNSDKAGHNIKYTGLHTFDEANAFFDLIDADCIVVSLNANEVFCFKGELRVFNVIALKIFCKSKT
jgi:hypothetical protein